MRIRNTTYHPAKIVLLALSSLFLLFSIFTLLAPFVAPFKMVFLQFFSIITPTITVINIALFIITLLFWRRISIVPLLALLLSANFTQVSLDKIGISQKSNRSDNLVVATYNVNYFSNQNSFNATKIANMVQSEKVDLIVMQEFEAQLNYNLYELVSEFSFFPFNAIHSSKNSGIGMALFSRHPIIRSEKITFPHSQNGFMWADILINNDTVRVFNCHMQTTGFYSTIDKGNRVMRRTTKENFLLRAEQSKRVRDAIDSTIYPLLVCGDFNDTPRSYTYKTIKGNNLKDSKNGVLWKGSYRWSLNLLRIDYILHSKEFNRISHRVGKYHYSDHKPIFVELEYRN